MDMCLLELMESIMSGCASGKNPVANMCCSLIIVEPPC